MKVESLVALQLVGMNSKIVEAMGEFVNPDNLLALPDDLREQLLSATREFATLVEMAESYMDAR